MQAMAQTLARQSAPTLMVRMVARPSAKARVTLTQAPTLDRTLPAPRAADRAELRSSGWRCISSACEEYPLPQIPIESIARDLNRNPFPAVLLDRFQGLLEAQAQQARCPKWVTFVAPNLSRNISSETSYESTTAK